MAQEGAGGSSLTRIRARAGLVHAASSTTSPAISVVVMIVLWYLLIAAANGNALVAKDPATVFGYLFLGPSAGDHQAVLGHQLALTLRDATLGYVTGSLVAIIVACLIVLYRSVEQTVTPVMMVLRTAPIVAMTPLLTLVFGNGLLAVTVISTIIVFFPSLINMIFGLRSASPGTLDLMESYGASRYVTLWKVRLPSSLPAFFASARIAVPTAIIGALVAEWLATGQGMGYFMLISTTTFDYEALWASVAVLTVVTVVIYGMVGIVEAFVLGRLMASQEASGAPGAGDASPGS